jgi:hypothetical protein
MTRRHTLALVVAGALVVGGTGAALASGAARSHPAAGVSSARPGPGFGARGFVAPRSFGFGLGFGLAGGLWRAAADYLGVSASTLLGDLRSGRSLAEVADSADGKSRAGLIDALVAYQKSQVDSAVKAGKLSQGQADRLTANLQQRIAALVDATRPAAPVLPGGRGFGFGFGGGRHGWRPPPAGRTNA